MTTEERLEKLEQELGRTRIINRVIVMSGFVVLTAIWGFASETTTAQNRITDVVRAKAIIVEDENGVIRMSMSINENNPRLDLYNNNGEIRTSFGLNQNYPYMVMGDENGKKRVSIDLFSDDPALIMNDRNGNSRITVALLDDNPALALSDSEGNGRATLSVLENNPSLILTDESGKTRSSIGKVQTTTNEGRTTTYPESTILLYDQDGYVQWSAP